MLSKKMMIDNNNKIAPYSFKPFYLMIVSVPVIVIIIAACADDKVIHHLRISRGADFGVDVLKLIFCCFGQAAAAVRLFNDRFVMTPFTFLTSI